MNESFQHTDMRGDVVTVGDRIMVPGYPMFAVNVEALVPCEPECAHGAAAIIDPESGKPDEVCLGSMVRLAR